MSKIYVIQSRTSLRRMESVVLAVRSSAESALVEARSFASHAAPNGSTIAEQGNIEHCFNIFINHPKIMEDDRAYIIVWAYDLDAPVTNEIFGIYQRNREMLTEMVAKGKW